LPQRLSLALASAEPEAATRAELSCALLSEAQRERVLERALALGLRAQQREPRASAVERELALGVLLVLCSAVGPGQSAASR
jgi:hypothetical protein